MFNPFGVVSGVKDVIDDVQRIRERKGTIESQEALTALYEKHVHLLTEAMALVEHCSQISQVKRDLEEKLAALERERCEFERYELAELAPGVFAYAMKKSFAGEEPGHHLCANCRAKGEKSILQRKHPKSTEYECPRCRAVLRTQPPIGPVVGVADIRHNLF
jgi:hypothetical protein